jgi:lipopolysaccharide transport system permease protein
MTEEMISYEPDNLLKKGYLSIFKDIYAELINNRWLTYQLFRRDFLALYRQSIVGVFWALIIPAVSVGTFILLSESGVLSVGEISVPYPIFAVLGLALWQLFAMGLIATSNSLVNAGAMIRKINFSKKALVLASGAQSFVPFIIQIGLVAILCLAYGSYPSIWIIMLPVAVVPIILLMLGLGFMLSLLNAVARDVGNLVAIVTSLLMFITPIFYARPTSGILATITEFNPLSYLISGYRDLALTGHVEHSFGVLISSMFAILLFAFSLLVFHLTEVRIAERV